MPPERPIIEPNSLVLPNNVRRPPRRSDCPVSVQTYYLLSRLSDEVPAAHVRDAVSGKVSVVLRGRGGPRAFHDEHYSPQHTGNESRQNPETDRVQAREVFRSAVLAAVANYMRGKNGALPHPEMRMRDIHTFSIAIPQDALPATVSHLGVDYSYQSLAKEDGYRWKLGEKIASVDRCEWLASLYDECAHAIAGLLAEHLSMEAFEVEQDDIARPLQWKHAADVLFCFRYDKDTLTVDINFVWKGLRAAHEARIDSFDWQEPRV